MVLSTSTIESLVLRPDLATEYAIEVAVEAVAANALVKETVTGNLIGGLLRATTDDTGLLSIELPDLPQAGIEPANSRWRATFRLTDPADRFRGHLPVDRPPPTIEFELDGDTTWGDLVDVSEVPITPDLIAELQAQVDAAIEAAETAATAAESAAASAESAAASAELASEITGLTGEDAAVALLLDATSGSATRDAAVASFGRGLSVTDPQYAADPTGVADSTTAIQAAIDDAPTRGGLVHMPAGTYRADGLVIPAGVTLTSGADAHGFLYSSIAPVTIKARDVTTEDWVVTLSGSGNALVGINVDGNHGAAEIGGVKVEDNGAVVRGVHVDNCTLEGINVAGVANVIEDVLVTNVNLTAPTAQTGAVVIDGSDHYCSRVEAAGAPGFPGTLQSMNLYAASIYVPGTTCMFTSCIGELGDVGFHITGALNKFSTCRADLNHGHGYVVTGTGNTFASCAATENANGQSGLYDGFYVTGTSNAFAACYSGTIDGAHGIQRYAYHDTAQGGGVTQHNHYAACHASWSNSRMWKFEDFYASGPVLSPVMALTTSATPDVDGANLLSLDHTSPTTITAFVNGFPGQRLYIRGNSNVTIQHNGGPIFTRTGADRTLADGKVYRYTNFYGYWYEDAD